VAPWQRLERRWASDCSGERGLGQWQLATTWGASEAAVVLRPGVIQEEESGWEKGMCGTYCRVSKFVVVGGSLTTIEIYTLLTYQ